MPSKVLPNTPHIKMPEWLKNFLLTFVQQVQVLAEDTGDKKYNQQEIDAGYWYAEKTITIVPYTAASESPSESSAWP
jgi:hypothetical protein